MKRKLPKRVRRRPRPALEVVNQALLGVGPADTYHGVAAQQVEDARIAKATKGQLRALADTYREQATRWQKHSQQLADSNQRLDEEKEKLRRELNAWIARFDRLLEAMQHR